MEEEIRKTFENDNGFINKQKYVIEELNDDYVKMSYTIKKDGLNPYNIVHGGVLFGLADTTAGVLVAMHGKKCVTISSNINYLSAAKEGKIYAIAKTSKEGKKVGYYSVEIYDENDKLLSTANFNMYFLDK